MVLSDRLSAAAAMVTKGYRLADIGTDHGFVPILSSLNMSLAESSAGLAMPLSTSLNLLFHSDIHSSSPRFLSSTAMCVRKEKINFGFMKHIVLGSYSPKR